ncbi:MAG: hypothetical protein AB1798_13510 [Spirochaetota bacterium]
MTVERTITQIGRNVFRIEDSTARHLGIRISESKKNFAITQFTRINTRRGWIITDNNFEPWEISGMMESNDQIFLYGPYKEGKLLVDRLNESPEQGLSALALLGKALPILRGKLQSFSKLHADGILFLEDGGILFFPQPVMDLVLSQQNMKNRLFSYELFNHPEYEGERNLSFSLGVMLYKILTGFYPFQGEDELEIHEKMRSFNILSPTLKRPEIKEEVSACVMRALSKAAGEAPSLSAWKDKLDTWKAEGITREISEEERTKIREQAVKFEKKAKTIFSAKAFFTKQRTIILISVIAAALAAWFITGIVQNILKPPVTLGKSPKEVVEIFYTSINTLDHIAIEDCVDRGIARADINAVTNLFVISRMRLGQEGKTGLVDARQWVEQGRPSVSPGDVVFGVANLQITREREDVYIARYERWGPKETTQDNAVAGDSPPQSEGFFHQDRLHLQKAKDHWVIYKIEELERKPL